MIKKLLLVVLAVFVVSSAVQAVNLEQAELDEVLSTDGIAYIDNNVNESAGIVFTYEGSASTQGAVTIARDNIGYTTITLQSPIGTVDATIYVNNTSTDTIGELADFVDSLSAWGCDVGDSDLHYDEDADLLAEQSEVYIGSDNSYTATISTGGTTDTDPYILSKRIAATDSDEVIRLGDVVGVPATAGDDIEIYEEDSSGTVTKLLDKDIQETSGTVTYGDNVIPLGSLLGGFEITQGSDVIIKINGSAAQATDGTDYLYFPYQREDRSY